MEEAPEYSVIIIGAGAAGIAAGNTLKESGLNFLIIEARDRLGGRVFSDQSFADFPIDLGGEFIHGENAVTHGLVHMANLRTTQVTRYHPDNMWWSSKHKTPAVPVSRLPPGEFELIKKLRNDMDHLANIVTKSGMEPETSVGTYLRSKGYTDEEVMKADVIFAQPFCVAIDELPVNEMIHLQAGYGECRIQTGQTSLLKIYAKDLPILYNQDVIAIDWNSSRAILSTEGGKIYKTRKVIITVPIGVLLANHITFSPPLPQSKQKAISAFQMFPATKLLYNFNKQFWSEDLAYLGNVGTFPRWWTPGYGQQTTSHVIICFATAHQATTLDSLPEPTILDQGLSELATLLDVPPSELHRHLISAKRMSWAHEKYTRGGYAIRKVGHVDAHVELARPVDGMIFFAGEATAYNSDIQTIHGAVDSGWRAGHEVVSSMGAKL